MTNRTVEIEREGANCLLSLLTLGCWWALFQTATIEIYELDFMSSIELKTGGGSGGGKRGEDDVIVCQLERHRGDKKTPLGPCSRPRTLLIDVQRGMDYTTADLYFEMKENWIVARHGVMDDDDCALSDDVDSEDELV